jgi:hypothetical protein
MCDVPEPLNGWGAWGSVYAMTALRVQLAWGVAVSWCWRPVLVVRFPCHWGSLVFHISPNLRPYNQSAMVRSKSSKRPARKRAPKPKPGATCAQDESRFFQLPQEVRDHIYALVFTTWYGRMSNAYLSLGQNRGDKHERDRRNKNALALLRTCRRVNEEVGDSWMRYGEFVFKDPRVMLDVLTEMPPEKLALLREMRVYSMPVNLSRDGGHAA